MEPTKAAFGIWSGGRFMNFGIPIEEPRMRDLMHKAYGQGVKTFMTADVYGQGAADEMVGSTLSSLKRDTYCLVGAVGHDFYETRRDGAKGFPRFTNPELRQPSEYRDYLFMAAEKSLARCRTDYFDLLLLHNPDQIGYSSDVVWDAMKSLKDQGLAKKIGVAPGPANGFTLDILLCLERFGEAIDWAMIILNPFEPWPGSLVLDGAQKAQVDIIARVVDYGGIFHGDVRPGHPFPSQDHRVYRPAGWVEVGCGKLDRIRNVAEKYGLTPIQLASVWTLNQKMVKCVVPTLIQESGDQAKPIEEKLSELAQIPDLMLTDDEIGFINEVGNNKGCMSLKGGNPEHVGEPVADRWGINNDLLQIADKWGINPQTDLVPTH